MKNFNLVMILFFLTNLTQLNAQQRGEGMKRIEQLEKLKLIEVLNMDEETTVKFFSQRRDYYSKRRSLTFKIDSLYINLEETLKSNRYKADDVSYKKMIDELLTAEKNLILLRNDYISTLTGLLNNEQISKYVIFEKRFREEIREMVEKHRRRRGNF